MLQGPEIEFDLSKAQSHSQSNERNAGCGGPGGGAAGNRAGYRIRGAVPGAELATAPLPSLTKAGHFMLCKSG
jgi:hypothetical protein